MRPLSKDKRDRLILVGLGGMALMAGLYFGLVSTSQSSLEQMARAQVEKELKLQGGQRLVSSMPEIQQHLDSTVADLKGLESNMASGDLYSWFIQTVNTFKDKDEYKVEIPQFSREVPGDVGMFPASRFPYKVATFHLRGSAHFHEFGRFVADFENSFPYMRIQNIELDPVSSGAASGQGEPEKLSFKMEVVVLVNSTPR